MSGSQQPPSSEAPARVSVGNPTPAPKLALTAYDSGDVYTPPKNVNPKPLGNPGLVDGIKDGLLKGALNLKPIEKAFDESARRTFKQLNDRIP
jgi:hypothetical protein